MRLILSAAFCLMLGVSAQAETVWMGTLGCKSKDTAMQAAKLMADGDKAGHDRISKEKSASGECAALKKGTKVKVDTMALEDGMSCVRQDGAPSCLWMPLALIN
jgi:hypothetical protein